MKKILTTMGLAGILAAFTACTGSEFPDEKACGSADNWQYRYPLSATKLDDAKQKLSYVFGAVADDNCAKHVLYFKIGGGKPLRLYLTNDYSKARFAGSDKIIKVDSIGSAVSAEYMNLNHYPK